MFDKRALLGYPGAGTSGFTAFTIMFMFATLQCQLKHKMNYSLRTSQSQSAVCMIVGGFALDLQLYFPTHPHYCRAGCKFIHAWSGGVCLTYQVALVKSVNSTRGVSSTVALS